MVQDLNNIQHKLTIFSRLMIYGCRKIAGNSMRSNRKFIGQRAHQNWITLGDNNIKFQVVETIQKSQTLFRKLWIKTEFSRRTKILYCRTFRRNSIRD